MSDLYEKAIDVLRMGLAVNNEADNPQLEGDLSLNIANNYLSDVNKELCLPESFTPEALFTILQEQPRGIIFWREFNQVKIRFKLFLKLPSQHFELVLLIDKCLLMAQKHVLVADGYHVIVKNTRVDDLRVLLREHHPARIQPMPASE